MPGPVPGAGQDGQQGVRVRYRGQDGPGEPVEVAAPADEQPGAEEHEHRAQQDGGAPERDPPARRRERGQGRQRQHEHVEQDRGVGRGVGRGQGGTRRDHAARQRAPVSGPQHAPGRQRDQEQGQRVVRGERAQVQRRAQQGEQRGAEEPCPPPVPPPGCAEQQRGRAQHEDQRQDPGPGQAARPVGERAERRVDHRCAREVIREGRDRGAVQPVCPLQMAGPQVQALVLEGRVGPQQPDRQQRLDDEHGQQRPPAGHSPAGRPVRVVRFGLRGHERARGGGHRRRRLSLHHEISTSCARRAGQLTVRLPGTPTGTTARWSGRRRLGC